MPNETKDQPAPKRGRPATGKTKVKLSATVNPSLIEAAMKQAYSKGESLSQFVSRAIQNQLLGS
ncbi:hypothetical protein JIN84_05540 [Luteolibacter yonseiensis]|uniref:Uncharacterized protein n=1 Tax=Luteolibacter yonseiensis TaxID=1144680 RepID=A0A934V9E8_9BACT|nr:hypothetical protein [Luteolibacter yonseiensis]MBK1815063.1 hypothetical protein [Luteolibacter yonseiensis]